MPIFSASLCDKKRLSRNLLYFDKELANAFLYESAHSFDDFTLQPEEVSVLNDFEELWTGVKDKVNIRGFEMNHEGRKMKICWME
ncbi:hypothetical protein [Peribacillus simplex]|uniref:hypothetical protein n=1 Tax=Peribacillus simplex TaxID=1478 RepID=UPI001F4FFEAC|nr:hypothetical protein [Peribacillus simplex]